jgi:hypothetical protein
MAIIWNPELSKIYWIPDNSFAVSGMTFWVKWDSRKKWGQIYFFLSPLVATKIAEKPGPENNHE